jgi:hypothetical protein
MAAFMFRLRYLRQNAVEVINVHLGIEYVLGWNIVYLSFEERSFNAAPSDSICS